MASMGSNILCTGWATKRGAVKKNWKRRYFVLRSDGTLSYYKDGWSPNSKPQGVILVEPTMTFTAGAMCSTSIDWPASSSETARFQLGTAHRTFYIFCDTPEAAAAWVAKIRALSTSPGTLVPSKTAPDISPEEQQALHDRIKAVAREEGNRACFDCGAKGTQPWATWNIGAFLCMRCAGIHRGLGVHVSKVKSVTLDSWSQEHVTAIERMGNTAAGRVWEASLPADFERPQEKGELEKFITQKYVNRKWALEQRRVSVGRTLSTAHAPEPSPAAEGFSAFANSDSDDDSFPTNFGPPSSSSSSAPSSSHPAPPAPSGSPLDTARRASLVLAQAASAAAAADPMAAHQWA